MKFGKFLLAILATFVILVLIMGGCAYRGYTQAVTLDEVVKSRWAQVENQLQRRFDLIPNVVETVKGVVGHEQEVFLGIAKARESYFQAKTTGEKAQAASAFESALSRLLVLQENYPQLKANEAFLKLQDQLEGTENRLSVERRSYNDAVQTLNTFRRKPLGAIFANLAGVEAAEYFEVEEAAKAAPKVDFGKA